jgi:hypothetical protein
MRTLFQAALLALAIGLVGCGDDDAHLDGHDHGEGGSSGTSDSGSSDSGGGDSGSVTPPSSRLERPHPLPRPPLDGLPDDLRPPR